MTRPCKNEKNKILISPKIKISICNVPIVDDVEKAPKCIEQIKIIWIEDILISQN